MYLAAIVVLKAANSLAGVGGSKGLSNDSMADVDELFKSRISMFDNIRSLKWNLNGMGMLYSTCTTAIRPMLKYIFCIDEHQTFMADSRGAALTA